MLGTPQKDMQRGWLQLSKCSQHSTVPRPRWLFPSCTPFPSLSLERPERASLVTAYEHKALLIPVSHKTIK